MHELLSSSVAPELLIVKDH